MNKLLLIALAVVGVAQSTKWSDGKGMTATAAQSAIDQSPKNKLLKMTLAGDVLVVSVTQGISMQADTIQFNAKPNPKDTKAYLLDTASAQGHVVVEKTVASASGKRVTRIEGPKGDFVAGTTTSVVNMTGPTKIQTFDEAQHPTMVATGTSAVASLEPSKQSNVEDALKEATLEGPAHLDLSQFDAKSKKQSVIHASSDRMILQIQPGGKKVTLIGNVHMTGDQGELSGAQQVVFVVDKSGEFHLTTAEGK